MWHSALTSNNLREYYHAHSESQQFLRIPHHPQTRKKKRKRHRAWWPALYLLQDACIKQGVYLTCRTPPPPGLLLTPEDYTGQRPWVPLDRVDLSPKSRSRRKKRRPSVRGFFLLRQKEEGRYTLYGVFLFRPPGRRHEHNTRTPRTRSTREGSERERERFG